MTNVYDTLIERGYFAQATHPEEIREFLAEPGAVFYIGFDPTADSLHIGHLTQMMVMAHMQKAGHIPIALMGGGTGMIGDPSGRSDMRQLMTPETIQHNVKKFKNKCPVYLISQIIKQSWLIMPIGYLILIMLISYVKSA